MNTIRAWLLFTICSLVAGCKLALIVPSGGDVVSESQLNNCAGGQICEFEIHDATFDETFTAQPREGYVFSNWEEGLDGERFRCRGSTDPVCRVRNTQLAPVASLIPVSENRAIYYLLPRFEFVGIDTDNDGAKNFLDDDDDNDGVLDVDDDCPLDDVNEDGYGCPVYYANSSSILLRQGGYLYAPVSEFESILGRSDNGSGEADAWTISAHFKPGTHTGSAKQTLIFFGGDNYKNEGHIWLYYKGNDRKLRLEYGKQESNLEFTTSAAAFSADSWTHVMVTYNGGTTGDDKDDVDDYFSRFRIFIDGQEVSTSNKEDDDGWDGSIPAEWFLVGVRGDDKEWLKEGSKLDELAVWSSDQSDNALAIYNSGIAHSLTQLDIPPLSWWRLGDGDIAPTLSDVINGYDFTMSHTNSKLVEIVSDAPL